MASRVPPALFRGSRSVPFALYRSGTSRGVFMLESDVPAKGPERDAVLCRVMGSGHPQQLEGLGGGTGPTSKVALVGRHKDPQAVTYTFAQCEVKEARVDHSHGDCGNMIAAVAPFALESGLVAGSPSGPTQVQIHSLNTGALYSAEVAMTAGDNGPMVCYDGDLSIPGVPGPAAPVTMTTHGIAGSQTGRLLPTGRAQDSFDLGDGLGQVSATIVDFARALVMLDAREVLPHFGYASIAEATQARVDADAALNAALERVRLAAAEASGMGDCTGKDSPKLALLAPSEGQGQGGGPPKLACRYFVNPGRAEMHPTIAMTAAQAIAAGCLLQHGVARAALGTQQLAKETSIAVDGGSEYSFAIEHAKGIFPVRVTGRCFDATDGPTLEHFPDGVPVSASYTTTVRPVAAGRAFI